MGCIGFFVGFTGFLLKSMIEWTNEFKTKLVEDWIEEGEFLKSWALYAPLCILLVLISAGIVVFVEPKAAGSGVPG